MWALGLYPVLVSRETSIVDRKTQSPQHPSLNMGDRRCVVSMGGTSWQHACEGHSCLLLGGHIHFCTHRDTKEIGDIASGLLTSNVVYTAETLGSNRILSPIEV